jgi:hypothetical protein
MNINSRAPQHAQVLRYGYLQNGFDLVTVLVLMFCDLASVTEDRLFTPFRFRRKCRRARPILYRQAL